MVAETECLENLFFSTCLLGPLGIQHVMEGVRNRNKSCGGLKSLELSCDMLGHKGAAALGKSLATNKTVERLTVSRCELGDAGIAALAASLATNDTIQEVYIHGEQLPLGEGATVGIAALLTQNKTVKSLSVLPWYEISGTGLASIAKSLQTNNTLESLYLNYKTSTVKGDEEVSKALKVNMSLKYIKLSSSSENGVAHIAQALANNESLESVDFSLCYYTTHGSSYNALFQHLPNMRMKSLNISGRLNGFDRNVILEALRRNTSLEDFELCHRPSHGNDYHDVKDSVKGEIDKIMTRHKEIKCVQHAIAWVGDVKPPPERLLVATALSVWVSWRMG